MIYLDNSATTRKKPLSVQLSFIKGLVKYSANPGRSSHKYSLKTSLKILEARENISKYFNATQNHCVIFTQSCTEALNLAILGTAQKNKHIISTLMEHNSVLRPLQHLKDTHNISFSLVKPNSNGAISPTDIEKAINKDTYMIIINHTSNVTGNTNNIYEIGKIAKQHNIKFLVDAAQSAGHEIIDIKRQNIDYLALAGHKGLYGPQGVGVLIANTNHHLNPIKYGGTGTSSNDLKQPKEYPDGYESGTISTPNIIALNEGVKFVSKKYRNINNKTFKYTLTLINYLKTNPFVKIYSKPNKSGIVSFSFNNIDNNEVINILNKKYKIAVRGGLHCAPKIHEHLNTLKSGLIRVSFGHYNTNCHVKKLIHALKSITHTYYNYV